MKYILCNEVFQFTQKVPKYVDQFNNNKTREDKHTVFLAQKLWQGRKLSPNQTLGGIQ